MHTENKKELALEVIHRLKQAYPDAACSLDYNEAWKLLVSVRLAAQCTDARVNMKKSCVPVDWEKARQGISVPACGCCGMCMVEMFQTILMPC